MVFSFPSDLYSTDPNFTTLFRLLDDFDTYSREVQDESASTPAPASRGGGGGRHRRGPRPRFDIRETPKSYELYGEVPGMSRNDIHIELTQENVLLITGHVDRPYDTPPPPHKTKPKPKPKPVTVTGEKCDDCDCGPDKPCDECERNKCECTKGKHCDVCGMDTCPKHGDGEGEGKKKAEGPGGEGKEDDNATIRYLLKERFVGDFAREFAFPGPLQEFDIGASLENGVLKVVVPKQEVGKGGRRIEIQ
ncbi:HSP20-like chaperone [Cercophora samala]|uniref:HSP20-like chaperone n=1 Tax=Cercophora samala TaxID=330535 RepID=A0AA40DAE9_9PEZI|nr:HSP20-like chaperone [Cercophora samala]